MLATLFWLLVAHAVCDYPLQGDFLAVQKNPNNPKPFAPWWQCMLAHCMIQGGGVALVTNSITLGCVEAAAHFNIDFLKCDGKIGFNSDQLLHVISKLFWLAILVKAAADGTVLR